MAKNVTLRDYLGRVLGYEEERDGKIYLMNQMRRELGYFDIRKNETWQTFPTRKQISKEGDLLVLLLEKQF